MAARASYTIELTAEQAKALRAAVTAKGFEFREVPHALFAAAGPKVQVVAYRSGKCVVQGKGTEEFVQFVLEPEVTGQAILGYEKVINPRAYEAHIGVDESGKGDFFGPLVTAGVYADASAIEALVGAGVKDSKAVTSDKRVAELAEAIAETPGARAEVIAISPAKYNELQQRMRTVNELLGWAHAKVIENMLGRVQCARAVSDQFARTEWTIRKHLGPRGRAIELEQRHKAESDPVVAAASIIARDRFVRALDGIGNEMGERILPGASAQVKALAVRLVRRHGAEAVSRVVKTHFKTWNEVLREAGAA
ncbi:MAG: ribonuclease HIII [Verrucomicrobiae bacterium]|nr:ribonuclease HIII [Verrucomicrobiae bacterium]